MEDHGDHTGPPTADVWTAKPVPKYQYHNELDHYRSHTKTAIP